MDDMDVPYSVALKMRVKEGAGEGGIKGRGGKM